MRRLLFITQRVDADDPVLGATVAKIRALAARVDELVVVAQSATSDALPANVEVRTFGAPRRIARGARFERELARVLPADAVVAHMVPLYVVLAAPLVRPRRIPLVLWYTHWKATPLLRAAATLATAIASVDRRSFPLPSSKVHAIGHGIDVSEFPCTERVPTDRLRALVLGRYSPAKGIPTILEAARSAGNVDVELHGVASNDLEREHRRELEQFGVELGDAVPRAQLPEVFGRSDVLVNNMRAGAPDKVVYEAGAACLPVLAANPVFDELFGELPLAFVQDDVATLVDRLTWLAGVDARGRAEIGRTLRERVAGRHSVETWADGVLEAAT
ncbi:MAG TPA: glycosyltransferase family 4 protein [Gaiellaceae bacterium]|nr:glycosyltransferase family 4 protein [Gaiellaceae bacterium]